MTKGFFVVQVFALAGFLMALVPNGFRIRAALALTSLLAITGTLAGTGSLAFGTMFPPPGMIVIAIAFGLTTALGLSNLGKRLTAGLDIATLIGFQGFRVLVEVFLWMGHQDGFVPVQMTWEGRNFDVLTGITAPILAWFVVRGRVSNRGILIWNLIGLALLGNVVTIAILSMPIPIRVFWTEPANTFVATAPYIWLPVFLVQAAWLGHLLVFRRIRA